MNEADYVRRQWMALAIKTLLDIRSGALQRLLDRHPKANKVPTAAIDLGTTPASVAICGHSLRAVVEALKRAGLVDEDAGTGQLTVTEQLTKIQEALGLSLRELALWDSDTHLVRPVFGSPVTDPNAPDVFVLMPFRSEFDTVYEDHIQKVATGLGLTVRRPQDIFKVGAILDDIWASICASKIVIAECTGRNPNVFYEIGIAHTVGKPVVLITQTMDDIPFDLKHLRAIGYQTTEEGLVELDRQLAATLKDVLVTLDSACATGPPLLWSVQGLAALLQGGRTNPGTLPSDTMRESNQPTESGRQPATGAADDRTT